MPLGAAGAYLISSGANALFQGATNAKDRAFNAMEAQKNRAWQEAMWNKQNEYNDPSMEMARLKAAGLNPNLVYGQGTPAARADKVGGGAQARSSSSAPRLELQQYQNIKNQQVNENLLKAKVVTETQAAMLQTLQADKLMVETDRIKLANQITDSWGMTNAYMQNLLTGAQIKGIKETTKRTTEEIGLKQAEKLIKNKQWERFRDYEIEPNTPPIYRLLAGIAKQIIDNYKSATNRTVTLKEVNEMFPGQVDTLDAQQKRILMEMLKNQ